MICGDVGRDELVSAGIQHLELVVVCIENYRATIGRRGLSYGCPVATVGLAVVAVLSCAGSVCAQVKVSVDAGSVPAEEVLVFAGVGRQELHVKLYAGRGLALVAGVDVLRPVRLEIWIVRVCGCGEQCRQSGDGIDRHSGTEKPIHAEPLLFVSFVGRKHKAYFITILPFLSIGNRRCPPFVENGNGKNSTRPYGFLV